MTFLDSRLCNKIISRQKLVRKQKLMCRRLLSPIFLAIALSWSSPYAWADTLKLKLPDQKAPKQSSSQTGQSVSGPNLKDYPYEVLKSFRDLFSLKNLTPLLVSSSGAGVASMFDDDVQERLDGTERLESVGEVGRILGKRVLLSTTFGSLLLVSNFYEHGRFRSMSFSLAQGYVLNSALTGGIKLGTGRRRPNGNDNLSFPSGHASNSFMWAAVVSHYYGRKAAIPAYATAAFVGFSRLAKNAHFLSDVVAGAGLGYIVGCSVVRKTESVSPKRHLTWFPTLTPGNVGVNFTLSF